MKKALTTLSITLLTLTAFSSVCFADAKVPTASFSFDESLQDATAVERKEYYSDNGIVESDGTSFYYEEGMLNSCLHTNGTEALKLPVTMNTESYTISYWIKADKITNCTPSLMVTADGFQNEKFINLTLSVDNISPCIWTHMLDPYDERCSTGVRGLLVEDEWLHITMVVDESITPDTALKEYAIELDEYNSVVFMYANGYLISTGRVPKGMCTGSTEYWFGINIWDDIFKGCIDELYFYDSALSAEEVKEVFVASGGDPNAAKPETNENNSHRPGNNFDPNGGSFSDDYNMLEQGTISGNNNHLNLQNASPLATQGYESTTNMYSKLASIAGGVLLILGIGMLLQYIKKRRNSYN